MNGTVFKIEEFTVHDGPGTRVTVFLKGCPLRCRWCHNPEGLKSMPELMFKESKCIQCGLCFKGCNHEKCQMYNRCLYICPNALVSECGQTWEPALLAAKLNSYAPFIKDGGVTFSGGEPLLQAGFVAEVCEYIPKLHKAMQTSGYARAEVFQQLAKRMDYILFDLKLADSEAHKLYTGVDNAQIHENFVWLKASGIPYVVRIPLIPGITDTPKNLAALASMTKDCKVELMNFNPFASAKYPTIGRVFDLPKTDAVRVDLSMFNNAVIV